MMKKRVLTVSVLIICLSVSSLFAGGQADRAAAQPQVELEFCSWRTEDVPVYTELIAMFEAENPDITVTYRPYRTEEYQTVLAANFQGGTAADVIHLRAYGNFEQFAEPGYLMPLTEEMIPELAVFSEQSLAGGTSIHDGNVYGVPYASQSLVIYYNVGVYDELGLTPPDTWDEYIANLNAVKDAGYMPLANGSYTGWMNEVMHGTIGPAFFGGNEFYEALMVGDTNFTDERYRNSLERLLELTNYMPSGYTGLDYVEQQMLFINEMAVHFMGGVWEDAYFRSQNPNLDIDIFIGPKADPSAPRYISTYMDGSYGINQTTPHSEEAIRFVQFLASREAQQFLSDQLGVKTEHPEVIPTHPILEKVMADDLETTPYLMLVSFRYKQPTGSSLIQTGLQALLSGQYTSQRVVNEIQEGVSQYFEPFQD